MRALLLLCLALLLLPSIPFLEDAPYLPADVDTDTPTYLAPRCTRYTNLTQLLS